MRRRDFIILASGVVIQSPPALAQRTKLSIVGFLGTGSSKSDSFRAEAAQKGLKEAGFVDGQNVLFEYRWAEDHTARLPALATELVNLSSAVIVAIGGNATAFAAKSATATIPIVFAVGGDPVKLGLVASLNRPGGNVTGVSFLANTLLAKQFEVVHESIPKAGPIGFLLNGANPNAENDANNVLTAAAGVGRQLLIVKASDEVAISVAFDELVQKGAGAVIVGADPFFTSQRQNLVETAARRKMPAIYPIREYALVGGLMSYGASVAEAHRIAGSYAGRILGGEKPSELPVQQSTKVELVVNLKVAKALDLVIPPHVIGRADEVIE
jgi:putative tryptophan/tyrosine transport system substrate-binding protein